MSKGDGSLKVCSDLDNSTSDAQQAERKKRRLKKKIELVSFVQRMARKTGSSKKLRCKFLYIDNLQFNPLDMRSRARTLLAREGSLGLIRSILTTSLITKPQITK